MRVFEDIPISKVKKFKFINIYSIEYEITYLPLNTKHILKLILTVGV